MASGKMATKWKISAKSCFLAIHTQTTTFDDMLHRSPSPLIRMREQKSRMRNGTHDVMFINLYINQP